ncbi:MAG: 30S ribosomal protein S12 methylthiotransferase RimO [Oscillibacter sp.]|nr:30S ribosomal protein S12 methylthiotransferase RimO [Oscillibacter sp.]
MSYKLHFISLGCAKNVVNCEQMMSLCRQAGHTLLSAPEGADAVVVNTCGFLSSANEEAIQNILQMARLKAENKIKKILVTGCMPQRYQGEILEELPEVDGILGTGSYKDIVSAVEAVMAGERASRFGNIDAPVDEFGRELTTPPWYAYLRIAEGCDNWCAFCIIPRLRGKYRSRPMDKVLAEARALADRGVKELIVVAQDITRYGTDWDGQRHLADLLEELCQLDFHWIRLHYLYPDQMDGRLIDVIAREPKILKYLDIPLQHCNDDILRKMNRRGDKAYIEDLLDRLRERIPGLVLRTSLITGLPGEGEAEFEELCRFLWDQRMLRAGVFPYSPEEGTPAAKMDRVDTEEAERRAELVVDIQSRIMDEWNEDMQGEVLEVLCEGFDGQSMSFVGRSWAESPDIDGRIYFTAEDEPEAGTFVRVRITGVMDGELTGEALGGPPMRP